MLLVSFIIKERENLMRAFLIRTVTSLALIATALYLFVYAYPIVTVTAAIAALLYILIFEYPKLFDYKKPLSWLIMLVYPILPFALATYMCAFYNYRILIFYMAILTSCHDTGGYLAGSLFGKHKLAPNISPKKSWEGFLGGYILVIIALLVIAYIQNATPSKFFIFSFAFAISILATIGDLFESYLKRKADIKDTGKILPGHGGFLDRLDSYLAVIFLFYILRDYLVHIFNI